MTKKKVLWILAIVIVLLFAAQAISMAVSRKLGSKLEAEAFERLFVTERAAVAGLRDAVQAYVENFDSAHCQTAHLLACETEFVCGQSYLDMQAYCNTGTSAMLYYATFFKDIDKAIQLAQSPEELTHVVSRMDQIIAIYDDVAAPTVPASQISLVQRFYTVISGEYQQMDLSYLELPEAA